MKKGAVRRLLRFGNRPALFAGDLGRPLHRIAQERRHVVGEARAAAFRLALVRTLRALLTLTARLRRLGVGVPVTPMLALSAVRPLGGSLRRPCSTRLLAVFRTLLATRLSALLGTCLRS